MKGALKANTTDRYLSPIRNQIIELIEADKTVLEFGCGNGDLLFKLSHKIESGIGLDHSKQLISFAQNQKEKQKITNLDFRLTNVVNDNLTMSTVNYSVSSLLFHLLEWDAAQKLLLKQLEISETTIICAFSQPQNWRQQLLLWLDQRFSKTYRKFKTYGNNGYFEGLIQSLENIEVNRIDTFDPVIKIYMLRLQ